MTPQEFTECFRSGVERLSLTDAEKAQLFSASVPTMKRWLEGRSVPTPGMRLALLSRLDDALNELVSICGELLSPNHQTASCTLPFGHDGDCGDGYALQCRQVLVPVVLCELDPGHTGPCGLRGQ